jgi:hypothetical protein
MFCHIAHGVERTSPTFISGQNQTTTTHSEGLEAVAPPIFDGSVWQRMWHKECFPTSALSVLSKTPTPLPWCRDTQPTATYRSL